MTKREARLAKNAKIRAANKAKIATYTQTPKNFIVTQIMWGKKTA